MNARLPLPLLGMMFILSIFSGCKKDDDNPVPVPPEPFSNGAFISNEGTFGLSNASVSFHDFGGDSVRNGIFSEVNHRPLGKLLQSMHLANGNAYMVLNLSDTIVVADAGTFKETGVITGLSLPRYMTSYNGKGYITQWGEGGVVKTVDMTSGAVLKTIPVGTGPEQVSYVNGRIVVCNGGGYTVDSTLSVIDPQGDSVVQTVYVGHNPKGLVTDRSNNVWVLCFGYIKYDSAFNIVLETPSKLVRLSAQSFQKTAEFIISSTKHPQYIGVSKDKFKVFYGGGFGFNGIYAMDISATEPPAEPLIDGSRYFYGFGVFGGNGQIFALDAGDFVTPGTMYRYDDQGNEIKSYRVGIAPNGVWFQ